MLNYYIIDTETTGLKVGYHEVTQISIIRCSDRHQLNYFIRAQYPARASAEALKVTGRTMADLSIGVSRKEAIEGCNRFLLEDGQTSEHRCIIAHNASFDRRFCHDLWTSSGLEFPANCWLCTMAAVKDYMTKYLGIDKAKKGLHDSMKTCGLKPRTGAHNAISDTQNTYILHNHLNKEGFDLLPYIKRFAHASAPTVTDEESDN